jgi:hypothetical protein
MTSGKLGAVVGVAALMWFAGCSDSNTPPEGPYVAGWYEVTHHTVGVGDCVVEGADATGLPVIRLTEEQYNSSPYYALRRCGAMEELECDNEDFFGGTSFVIPIQNGWQERKASAAFQPGTGDCYLSYGEATVMQYGYGVIVELRRYEELVTGVAQADCNHELAMELTDSMPCLEYEVIHGEPSLD